MSAIRTTAVVGLLWFGRMAGAAVPGGTVYSSPSGGPMLRDGSLRIEHGVPPSGHQPVRLAYAIVRDAQGRPVIQAYSFLLSALAFSRQGGVYPWPALCEYDWGWNDLTQRLVPRCSSGLMRDPWCALRGRVQFTGFLSPRIDVRPVVQVSVEGDRESLVVPARVVLHDPLRVSWTGIPVVLGELSTTVLEDGVHRLRIAGGFREFTIDGDPGTSVFEEGGDATVEFLVHNRPPRLVSLAVFAGTVTVYRGAWRREETIDGPRFILHREGGDIAKPVPALGDDAVIELAFSVPVTAVAVEARRPGGSRITAALIPAPTDEPSSTSRRAVIPWRLWPAGTWTFRIGAETDRGIALEPLSGERLPETALGFLDPDSGRCVACRSGPDVAHRIRIVPHR